MVIVFGIIATIVAGIGIGGRGDWSRAIANIGGWGWFICLILVFYQQGLRNGLFYALATALLLNIAITLFRTIFKIQR